MEWQGAPDNDNSATLYKEFVKYRHSIFKAHLENEDINALFFITEAKMIIEKCLTAPKEPKYDAMSIELQALVRDVSRKVENLQAEVVELRRTVADMSRNDRGFRILEFYGRTSTELLADYEKIVDGLVPPLTERAEKRGSLFSQTADLGMLR